MGSVVYPEGQTDPSRKPELVDVALERGDCTAPEGVHPVTWIEYDPEAWYPPPCMWCLYDSLSKAHDGCEHSHHPRWMHWRITGKAISWATRLGVLSGSAWRMGGGCPGCHYRVFWRGKRMEILGVRRDTWRCLIKGRHLPGDPVAFGYCSKCLPCPECGSKTLEHDTGCEF